MAAIPAFPHMDLCALAPEGVILSAPQVRRSGVVRSLPCEVPLSPADGMPVSCVVNTDNLHTIPKDRLRQQMAALSGDRLFALDQALRYSLDLG